MEAKGIKFYSNSDTEVLLKYWQNLNNSCLNYLDGMFAFVIWNGKNSKGEQMPSGVYIVEVKNQQSRSVKFVTLLKWKNYFIYL